VRTRRRPFTVHPLGGAVLGSGESAGVIDGRGEVYGFPGLYVVDASALPASPGAPPSMSIAAWSSWVAARFLEARA
jgi:cholesterol oxidase